MTGSLPGASVRAIGMRLVLAVLLAAVATGLSIRPATAQETTPSEGADAGESEVVLGVDLVDDVDEVVSPDRRSYTYTITVANHGTADATRVSVADELPSSLSVTGVRAADPWTCVLPTQQAARAGDDAASEPAPPDALHCELAALPAGSSAPPLTVDVRVADGFDGQIDYRVQAASADSEPVAGTETTVVAQQQPAALAVDLVDDVEDTVPFGGASYAYTVTVTNPGPVELTELSVADALPAGLRVAGVHAPGRWTCVLPSEGDTNEQLYCLLDTLAAGTAAPPLTIDVDVADDFSGRVDNTVEADSAQTEPVQATVTTTVDVETRVLGEVLEKPTRSPAPQVPASQESQPELAATGPWADHQHLAWLAALAMGLGALLLRAGRPVTARR